MMRPIITAIVLLGALWLAGLALFIAGMPREPLPASVKTDAIVVLTGGGARIERGFETLAKASAPLLFISGVGKEVTLAEMIQAHASPLLRARVAQSQGTVILGHAASTTQTNAQEVQHFLSLRSIHSVRLVTAHYHMPRSLLEFHRAMPTTTFVADPVFPEGFQLNEWWRHDTTRRLILSEYHKYWVARLRPVFA